MKKIPPTNPDSASPTVGIVTPCYNSQTFIGQCIASVDAQTYPHWLQVLVDDGSTDRTSALLADAAEHEPRRKAFYQSNAGPGTARNRGIRHLPSDTKYILCLDSDDYLAPDALETLVQHMENHPSVGLLKWESTTVDEDGNEATRTDWWGDGKRYQPTALWMRRVSEEDSSFDVPQVFTGFEIYPSCTIFRKSVFDQTAGFPEANALRRVEDMHLFAEMALRAPAMKIPDRLSYYRLHGEQLTADRPTMGEKGRYLQYAWHQNRKKLPLCERRRVEEALSFARLRYPFPARIASACRMIANGSLTDGLRVLGGALHRYGLSFLPHRLRYWTLARCEGWAV